MKPTNHPATDFRLTAADNPLLERMQPAHRVIIVDRHRHGNSYKALADAYGLPLGTVKSRLHRALDLLIHMRAQAAAENPVQNP